MSGLSPNGKAGVRCGATGPIAKKGQDASSNYDPDNQPNRLARRATALFDCDNPFQRNRVDKLTVNAGSSFDAESSRQSKALRQVRTTSKNLKAARKRLEAKGVIRVESGSNNRIHLHPAEGR